MKGNVELKPHYLYFTLKNSRLLVKGLHLVISLKELKFQRVQGKGFSSPLPPRIFQNCFSKRTLLDVKLFSDFTHSTDDANNYLTMSSKTC